DPANGFKFDPVAHLWYCDYELAQIARISKRIQRCIRPNKITPLDIGNGKPTLGKSMLARALNERDFAKRETFIALALNECAREKSLGVDGCINNYNDIYRAFEKAGMKLGFRDSYRVSNDFYRAVSMQKKAASYKSDADLIAAYDQAEKKSKYKLLNHAATNIANSVEGQLYQLSKTKRTPEEIIGIFGSLCKDYLLGIATLANAGLETGQDNPLLREHQVKFQRNFNAFITELVIKDNKLKLSDDERHNRELLIKQLKSMQEYTQRYAVNIRNRNLDDVNGNVVKPLSRAEIEEKQALNNGEAGQLLGIFERLGYHTLKNIDTKPFEREDLELKSVNKPFYLVMDHEQRKLLSDEQKDKLYIDPFHGAICCDESDKELFKEFLPSEQDLQKMRDYSETLRGAIAKHLTENGQEIEPEKVILDLKSHKLGNLTYKFYTFATEPAIQIMNNDTGEQFEYKLGVETNLKFETFKQEFSKAMMTKNAFEMNDRMKVADYIEDTFKSEKMHSVKNTDLDFPYFKKIGMSVDQLDGYIDLEGAYDGYVFENDKDNVQTKSTVFCPMYTTSGKIINAMAISDSGKQEFMGGAPVKGAFSTAAKYLKAKDQNGEEITGAEALVKNLSEAKCIIVTTDPISAAAIAKYAPSGENNTVVVSANTSSNLKNVAQNLARDYPEAGIAIFGENNIREAGLTGKNIGAHEAEHTARVALRDLRPTAKAYLPMFSRAEQGEGRCMFSELEQLKPEVLQKQVINAVIETITNQEIMNNYQSAHKNTEQKDAEFKTAEQVVDAYKQLDREALEPSKSAQKFRKFNDTLGYVSDVLFYSRYGVHGMFNDMLKFSSDYSFDVADYLDGKAAESVNKVKEMVSDVKQMFSSENKEQSTKHDLNESRVVSKKNIDTNNNRSKSYKR
ncbi:MAG: hypothetical protein SPK83_07385, partial [Succinivibrio dextrinosolvens]|nr:hypothetical protein [Succinivibrio dextrinosolvens]